MSQPLILVKALAAVAKAPQAQPQPEFSGKGRIALSPQLPGASTRVDAQGRKVIDVPLPALAQAYRLDPAKDNIIAFLSWLMAIDRPGVLGPTEFRTAPAAGIKREAANDAARLRQVQAALARRGYALQATGTWDQPTSSAVVAFKHSRGLHEPFKTPDGKWAITPFLDEAMIGQVLGS